MEGLVAEPSYNRAFSSAIPASAARVWASRIRRSSKNSGRRDVASIAPSARPLATSGSVAIDRWPIDWRYATSAGSADGSVSLTIIVCCRSRTARVAG